jgi:GNAT superfamily N-acetyltransferase
MKEARKIIRFPATPKEGRKQYLESDSKSKESPAHFRDLKSIVFNISSRHYLLRKEAKQLVTNMDIEICRHDESQDEDIQIGEALAFLVRSDLSLAYGSLFQVMDAHSQTLSDVYSALFRENDESINRLDEYDIFGTNILFIDYLYLHPEYRGYGLGRPILMGIIEEISCGADVVIIEPVPVRFEDEDKNAKLQLPFLNDEEYELARKKLCDYWKPLSFKPVEGTERFQFLSVNIMHPSVNELFNEMSENR